MKALTLSILIILSITLQAGDPCDYSYQIRQSNLWYGKYDLSTYGSMDGWAEVFPADNNMTYRWSAENIDTGYTTDGYRIDYLSAGTIYLNIQDNHNCVYRDSVTLMQPPLELRYDTIHEKVYDTIKIVMIDSVEVLFFTVVSNIAEVEDGITISHYGTYLQLSEEYLQCWVYSTPGTLVKFSTSSKNIYINDLQAGIYIFKFRFLSSTLTQRIFIQ